MDRRSDERAFSITVGARASRLSKAQVTEVFQLLPHISYTPLWIMTKGDNDKSTSLRSLEQTDFFTHEIERLQLEGHCRVSIHSAKDLPKELLPGLEVIAITKGLDKRDSLVFKDKKQELPTQARIGTSSIRREEALKKWRSDLIFVDIRGDIEERLALLQNGQIDALVVAECALIRLNLTHLPRLILEQETAKYQGQLAIIGRTGDDEMKELFQKVSYEAYSLPRP